VSNVLYPVGLIAGQRIARVNRVVSDEFEGGSVSTRRVWSAQNFKRRFTIEHAPLTRTELKYLEAFYAQRDGGYDAFWYRDNLARGGNASVRFSRALEVNAATPALFGVGVELDEVAPIRALPELAELIAAAGSTPLLWWDSNREIYFEHLGTATKDPAVFDAVAQANQPAWQGGTALSLGSILAQWQDFSLDGARWALTPGNVSGLTGAQPACTVFAIAKAGTISSKQVLFGVGAMGAGKSVGLAVSAANNWEPWIGGSETWGTALQSNAVNNTWRSFGLTWPSSSNVASFYVNAAAALTETETRAFTAGPATLGAAIDGTLKSTANLAHVLVWAAELTAAQVKAVHNLLGYQYGLATVA